MVLSFHQDSNQDLTSLRQFRPLPKQQKPVIAAVPAPSALLLFYPTKKKGSGKKNLPCWISVKKQYGVYAIFLVETICLTEKLWRLYIFFIACESECCSSFAIFDPLERCYIGGEYSTLLWFVHQADRVYMEFNICVIGHVCVNLYKCDVDQ